MFDSTLGRFMQRDPFGYADGMNQYVYAGGNPILNTDPQGKSYLGGIAATVAASACGQAQAKKKCGVETFEVKWTEARPGAVLVETKDFKVAVPGDAFLQIEFNIKFKDGGEFDQKCCEFEQWVLSKITVTRGGKDFKAPDRPRHKDPYSRDDDVLKRGKNVAEFRGFDFPGLALEKGDVLDFHIKADQRVIDTCNGNKEVATKGPHEATAKGTWPKLKVEGVPKTL